MPQLGIKDIFIKGARIMDPSDGKDFVAGIMIEGGHIREIGQIKNRAGFPVIDAEGLIASPGFTDMHVHLRDPGDDRVEDIASGIRSAVAGGFTSIACMPNTQPVIDSLPLVNYVKQKAESNDFNIICAAAMTKGQKGSQMTEMGLLADNGVHVFSDDGRPVADARLMYEIMRYSRQFSLLLMLHEEDYNFSKEGLVHEGYWANRLGLEGIPAIGEELVIARDLMLAKKTGARVHITHLSSAGSVGMIRKAKEDGINVTCDVTPHHLFFNHSHLKAFNTNLKVNPPIRGEEDQKALIEGLKDGTIDAIASDHAPHLLEEKNTTFYEARFGAIGMETAFKASYTKLCVHEGMGMGRLLGLMSSGPCKVLGIKNNKIEAGGIADLAIIDTGIRKTVENKFFSKSSNCPFIGQELLSDIVYTINKGKLSYIRE